MAEDPEKKFHSIMDKLFSSSSAGESSRGKKRSNQESALALVEPRGMGDILDVSQRSSVVQSNAALCRPWDRGDLMKRLATFRSMTWFGKAKVVDAVNCARRGWINVDTDIIACEACGARLLFSTPSYWPQQQVEKAALVFSLKLDSGHKLLCPWADNACDERLAEFPPTPFPVLVDKFKERCSKLLKLLALPVVSTSAIEYMRSPQLEDFLSQSLTLNLCDESASMSQIEFFGNEKEADSAKLYYQAQKLISLCGWEPRSLPYVVDCIEKPKGSEILKSSLADPTRHSSSNVRSAATGEREEVNEEGGGNVVSSIDPNSVVLDCGLCGASVGLWAYSTVPRPLELFNVAGVVEANTNRYDGQERENRDRVSEGEVVISSSNSLLLPPSSMKFTIAGGPPPTKQNFKAKISLPVIGRNLRARLSHDMHFGDHSNGSQLDPGSKADKLSMMNMPKHDSEDEEGDKPSQSETLEASTGNENYQMRVSATNSEHPSVFNPGGCETPENDAQPLLEASTSGASNTHSNQSESSTIPNSLISVGKSNSGTEGPPNQANGEAVVSATGKEFKELSSGRSGDFDPIRQHRHFCPWIVSTDSGAPGWQQTLTALQRLNDPSSSSPKTPPSTSSIIKVDDPITSVRRLFRSPSAKRPKLTPGSS